MPVKFGAERWDRIADTYRKWWSGDLDRPVIPVLLNSADPGRPEPDAPVLGQATCADFSIPATRLIDRADFELSKLRFLGDAFPTFGVDFGPGVVAAFLGGRLDNSSGRVWFFPEVEQAITDIHFEYDPGNRWFRRVAEIYEAAAEYWKGRVLLGMTDIGGNLDILSVFRPGEKLLLDLHDNPEEVKRLTWEAHHAWHRYFDEINKITRSVNPGYTDWSGIFSDEPSYVLQCDFSYMISPGMFKEFVRPELAETAKKLARSFYHLDGVGQLNHLESVLEVDDILGVQWVPGDGQPDCSNWPDVYRSIRRAGKLIQIVSGGFDAIDAVIDQTGSARGTQYMGIWGSADEEEEILKRLSDYGIVASADA